MNFSLHISKYINICTNKNIDIKECNENLSLLSY